jgi:hypothetical protein
MELEKLMRFWDWIYDLIGLIVQSAIALAIIIINLGLLILVMKWLKIFDPMFLGPLRFK